MSERTEPISFPGTPGRDSTGHSVQRSRSDQLQRRTSAALMAPLA
jgi:hypothetical protein